MLDAKFTIDDNFRFDFGIENGDIAVEHGLDTSIWLSLFTDARADESQVALPEKRRGWLGNLVSDVEGRQLGSFLWLTDQRRLTQSTVNEVVDYCRNALNWLIEDNICTEIKIEGIIQPRSGINIEIEIISNEGIITKKYVELWKVTGIN